MTPEYELHITGSGTKVELVSALAGLASALHSADFSDEPQIKRGCLEATIMDDNVEEEGAEQ